MDQLNLDAVPRKRVQLIADKPAAAENGGAGSGDGFIDAMMANKSNTEMAHAMKRAVASVGRKVIKGLIPDDAEPGLSDWAEGAPPQTGWWDVKLGGKLGKFDGDRMWFSVEHQQWRTEEGVAVDLANVKGIVYRGLRAPAPEGYSWLKPVVSRRVVIVE